MIVRDMVVIGASAGGIEACSQLLKLLPADFSASILLSSIYRLSPRVCWPSLN
jgi:hypothetical protein